MAERKKPSSHYFYAATIASTYAVMGVAWVLLSDMLLERLPLLTEIAADIHSLRDWGFVLVSTLVLYLLVFIQLRRYSHYLHRSKSQRSEIRLLSQFRKSIIDNASIWIHVLDKQGYVTVWNKAAEQISGYRREEVLKNSNLWEWLYPNPEYRASVRRISREIIKLGAEVQGFETTIHTKSGQEKIIAWNSRRFLNDKEQVMGAISIGRDITEQKHAVQALKEREKQLTTLMDNLPGMAYRRLNDERWSMKFVSSGCKALTGYERAALIDNREVSFASIIHEEDRLMVEREVTRARHLKQPFAMEYRLRRKDGGLIWVWEQGQAEENASEAYLEGIILDIDRRKVMEQELERMATHDPLTGLYNRRELESQLGDELGRAERYGRPLSLLWLDIDHFKSINDTYSHLAGDEVLRQLSHLLQTSVRTMDYVARYGGEELVIVLPELDMGGAAEMAERLRHLVETTQVPVAKGKEVGVTVSIGVAAFPVHGKTTAALFKRADQAMYQAKQQGRNRVVKAQP